MEEREVSSAKNLVLEDKSSAKSLIYIEIGCLISHFLVI